MRTSNEVLKEFITNVGVKLFSAVKDKAQNKEKVENIKSRIQGYGLNQTYRTDFCRRHNCSKFRE